MPNNRFLLLALFLPVLFDQAMGQSDHSNSIDITVQAAPWILTLPREGLVMDNQKLKPDGRYGYFLLQDNKNKMTISLFIEPVDKCKTSKECRDMVLKLGNPSWENPQNFVTGEIGEVSYFKFFMPSYKGMPIKQQHMYAQFVVEQFWVDLHISKTLYKPDEHQLFVDRVKSVKFEPKSKRQFRARILSVRPREKRSKPGCCCGMQVSMMKRMTTSLKSLRKDGVDGMCFGMDCEDRSAR